MGTVVKKSVSVPDSIWAAAEAEAASSRTTVSALISEALENLLATRAGLRAVHEWEREHGEFSMAEIAEADAALDAAGVGGALIGACSVNPGAVDASVAEGALRRGDAVVTGNADHLRALADGINRKLELIPA